MNQSNEFWFIGRALYSSLRQRCIMVRAPLFCMARVCDLCWNYINVYHAGSKQYNLTCWHLIPLPSIQIGCMHWQMYIEMESLANGHALKQLVWFYMSKYIEVCSYEHIIHDAIPWYYSNHLAKSPQLSISHKPNHIFIRIIDLKGTKTYTTTALMMGIEGQRSG